MAMRRTSKPWFGPKRRIGWGWTPTSWEGWVATAVFIVLVTAAHNAWHGVAAGIAVGALILAFLALAAFTGDPPGGPGSHTRD